MLKIDKVLIAIECCNVIGGYHGKCKGCQYECVNDIFNEDYVDCITALLNDCKDVINELDMENKRLQAQVMDLVRQNNQLQKERDAAVADLHWVGLCEHCKYLVNGKKVCGGCNCANDKWEWRGVQKEEQ